MNWQVKSPQRISFNAEVSQQIKILSVDTSSINKYTARERKRDLCPRAGGGWPEQPRGSFRHRLLNSESKEFTRLSSSITKSSDSFPSCSRKISSKSRGWGPCLVIHSTNINGPDQMGHSKVLEKDGT